MEIITAENNPFFEHPKVEKKKMWLVDLLQSIVIALFICIIVYLFIATPNQVTGPSMMSNFYDKDLVLTNKITQWLGNSDIGQGIGLDYARGDVIVFQKPGRSDLIKRIVGLPGESVMVLNGNVFVNNRQIRETYLPATLRTNAGTFAGEGQIITLKSDEYFVLGDNRGNSADSRDATYGPVKREWLKGKVILRYWPPERFGVIGSGNIEFLDTQRQ